jgi:hypothetical protein
MAVSLKSPIFLVFLSAALEAADKFMFYFTKGVCRLVPKQLTDLTLVKTEKGST